MMVEITVRVYRRQYAGDTRSYVESHVIDGSKLGWWKARSGNGDFVLLSAAPLGKNPMLYSLI